MITLITIGQTPRDDLMKAFKLSDINNVKLVGALDGVSLGDINNMEKMPGTEKLFVVLKDGTVNISHEIIEQRVNNIVKEYENSSEIIVILCMSEFNCTSSLTNIVSPIQLMRESIKAITPEDTTLICVPIEDQLASAKIKWDSLKGKKHYVAIYPKSEKILHEITNEIALYNPNHLIMDCYGYEYNLVTEIKENTSCLCHNAQHLIINKVKELTDQHG